MKKILVSCLLCINTLIAVKAQVPMPPINGNNPNEYIGNVHNTILQTFFTTYLQSYTDTSKPSPNEIDSFVIHTTGIQDIQLVESILSHHFFHNTKNTSFTSLPEQLEQMNMISQRCGNYLRLIDASIEGNLEISFETFNNNTIDIENDILQDNELTSQEKGILLSTSVTARYSAFFWKEFAENLDSKQKGSNTLLRLPGWLKSILRADASGAAAGATTGAIIGGTATIGTLTLPSWAVGGIAGGAGNSVGNAVEQLWNLIF